MNDTIIVYNYTEVLQNIYESNEDILDELFEIHQFLEQAFNNLFYGIQFIMAVLALIMVAKTVKAIYNLIHGML